MSTIPFKMNIQHAMIMTAGLGTRMRPFTDHINKCLLPVLGIPCAQWVLDSLKQAGIKTFISNLHYLPEKTQTGLLSLDTAKIPWVFSDESKLLLGSAGGIVKALKFFQEKPFFLTNADVICNLNWSELVDQHKKLKNQWGVHFTLAIQKNKNHAEPYAHIQVNPKTYLIEGIETQQRDQPFYSGAAIFEPSAFSHLNPDQPADFVKQVLQPAIQAKKAGAYLHQADWYDIGTPELWFKTHIKLLSLLEEEDLKSKQLLPVAWRQRVYQINHQIEPGIWVHQTSQAFARKYAQRWKKPCYLGAGYESQSPFFHFGPQAIWYPTRPLTESCPFKSHGIGYEQNWFQASLQENLPCI